MNNLIRLSGAAAIVWLAGCVQPAEIDILQREQRRLRGETGNVQGELQSIRATLADNNATVQQLQRELSAVKERIDETRYQVGRQIGQTSREGDQRVKDLELRVAKLDEALKNQEALLRSQEASLKAQEAVAQAREAEIKELRDALAGQAAATAAAPAEAVNDAAGAESEPIRREYDVAWRAMERKDYKFAIARFKDFLKKHAKSRLADNAQYWIGECHYALREFDIAIVEFDAVRRKYPQSDKVAAALLKQGFAFAELGEKVNARLILQEVAEKYPQSQEATRAKARLKTLES
jgi:tol-pal system protein YbgF